ncbi:MAG: ABC transporter substrate-binding protein [Actinomycetota bacterium]|nr:ABC transporter substrate-binding protein [Actinomycetota bacterium]
MYMLSTTWLRRLTVVAALAMLAAACGGPPGGEVAGETETAGGTEPTATEPTATEATETETAEATETETGGGGGGGGGAEADGTLTIGTLLPETGSLAFLGPPEFAGVDLAAMDINDAGGVLGEDVEVIDGDSGDTTTDIANQTTDRLLSQEVDVIIGAASSGVSLTVIDKITGAGVVQISPANTAPDFTDYEDNGLYFRTAPSDVLQGSILGEVIVEDGNATVGILALQDPYGEGLAEFITDSVENSGSEVVETIIYDPNAQNFDAEVQKMAAADPDAIVVIGFDESARILSSMIEAGIGPGDKNVYGTDGNMGNALGDQFKGEKGALEGMRGTTPLTDLSKDFTDRLLEVDPKLKDFNYAGESYDATVIAALAAIVAESDAGTDIGEELADVTRGGTKCEEFAECKELAEDGEDIDYDGITGPLELSDAGDPTSASFAILEFQENNQLGEDPEFRQAEQGEG